MTDTEPRADAAPDRATWGGKGAALARLLNLGFPVPPLAVVPPGADDVDAAVADALERLAHPPFVAVRSSAADEDGAEHAFAGALDSFLFVPPERVAGRVRDVRRSGDGERVRAYRAARGLDGPARPPAVLIQQIVDADVSGVAFSADPVTGDADVVVISAAWGLGSALVDGRTEAETLRLGPDGEVLDRTPGDPTVADRFDAAMGEGVIEVPATESGPVSPTPTPGAWRHWPGARPPSWADRRTSSGRSPTASCGSSKPARSPRCRRTSAGGSVCGTTRTSSRATPASRRR